MEVFQVQRNLDNWNSDTSFTTGSRTKREFIYRAHSLPITKTNVPGPTGDPLIKVYGNAQELAQSSSMSHS